MKEQQEEKKEMCPICKSQNIEYNDFFGIQCKNCGQLITPVPLVEQPVKTEEKDKEIAELKEWKRQAIEVMPDMQAIGKELNIPLGQSVHDKILPEIKRLKGLMPKIAERFYKYGMQAWFLRFKSDRLSNDEDYKIFNKKLSEKWADFSHKNNL